jgi:hypothetical protein
MIKKIHDIRHLIAIKGKIARIKIVRVTIVRIKIADGKPGYWPGQLRLP